MAQLFTNNATSHLAQVAGTTTTSLRLAAGEGDQFPNPKTPDFFLATLQQNSQIEIVKVIGRTGDTIKVVRAQEGTTAKTFYKDATIELRVTAGTLRSLINGVMHIRGNLDLSDGVFPAAPLEGDLYRVSEEGTINNVIYRVEDYVLYTTRGWVKFKNNFAVSSVNGKYGDVVLGKGDVELGNLVDRLQLVADENLADLTDVSKARDNLQVDVAGLALRLDMAFL